MSDIVTTQSLDLSAASMELSGALAISFPQSRAGSYGAAVTICRGASQYREVDVGGKLMHFAVFSPTQADMSRALATLRTLKNYKGMLVYGNGRILDWARTLVVLQCYIKSTACDNSHGHCLLSVNRQSLLPTPIVGRKVALSDDYATVKAQGQAYLFPCRLLAFNFQFKFQAGHPSSDADQIQAGAVREGCDWCPSFKPQNGGTQ